MRAFITGASGQDSFYLSALLAEKGYEVYGLIRRSAQPKVIPANIKVVAGDVTDSGISDMIAELKPDEIYNLAAMSHVGESFKIPRSTFAVNAMGVINLLEGARKTGARFYQASTSELFGVSPSPQDESTAFHPRSPYGVAKLAAYWSAVNYREAYGLFACNGILFNHESPYRGEDFVTQKICRGVARIEHGDKTPIRLGNLEARRDWGHAKDYVRGMWQMLQHEKPDDYVLATGETHSIREFLNTAFGYVGIEDWTPYVVVDESFKRPAEIPELCGNPRKAETLLGWRRCYSFQNIVYEMMEHALIKEYSAA